MRSQADQTSENKSKAAAQAQSTKEGVAEKTHAPPIQDQRSSTAVQRKLQEMASQYAAQQKQQGPSIPAQRKAVPLSRKAAPKGAAQLAGGVVQRDAADDIELIRVMSLDPNIPDYLRDILDEAYQASQNNLGGQLPQGGGGGAFAGRVYDATGTFQHQDVNYHELNPNDRQRLANLVHELTHVNLEERFGQDYVNYTNPPSGGGGIPDPTFGPDGTGNHRMTNEGARQGARRNADADKEIQVILTDLQATAVADAALSDAQRQEVIGRLSYGIQTPHLEFDTVINQIAVWLNSWGVESADSPFAAELEQVATDNYASRQAGNRNIASSGREPDLSNAMWQAPGPGGGGNGGRKKCYITTACVSHQQLPDDCEALMVLRAFRDDYIMHQALGPQWVARYYAHAPQIVAAIKLRQDADAIWGILYQIICTCVHAIQAGQSALALQIYKEMVEELDILRRENEVGISFG